MALRFNEDAYYRAHQQGEENRQKSKFNINEALKDVGAITSGLMAPKIAEKKAIKEREAKAPELLIKLRENNVPAEDANQAVANYIRTGSFDLNADKFGKKEGIFYQEEQGGPFKMQEVPQGVKPHVRGMGSGGDVPMMFFDPRNPNVPPRNLGNVPKGSKVISPPSPGVEKEDPETTAQRKNAIDTINLINRLKAAGEEIPEELMAQAQELAPLAGYEIEEKEGERGFFKKVFGLPGQKSTVFKKQGTPPPGGNQQQDIEQARQAVSKGVVTREEALKRLRSKYGPGVNF